MKDGDQIDETLGDLEETREIHTEIEQTRIEMTGTIDAIQEKLSPDVVAEQVKEKAQEVAAQAVEQAREHAREAVREATDHAKDAVYEATVGRAEQAVSDAGRTAMGVPTMVMETIKQNPLPAAVAALSLGWLWRNRSHQSESYYRYDYRTPPTAYDARTSTAYRTRYGTGYGYDARGTSTGDQGSGGVGQVADRVGETVGQATGAAGEVLSSAGHAAGQAVNRAGETVGDLASGAGRMAGSAGETATDLGSSILETISRNPLPAALTGVGLAWLWMSRSEDRPTYAYSGSHRWQGNANPADRGYGAYGSYDGGGTLTGQARDATGQVVDRAQNAAGQVADQVQDTAGQVQEMAGEMAGRVTDTAGQFVDEAQYRARRAGGSLQRMMDENPLMAGALAATAGLAVGLATPTTERERELMGETRDQFVRKAQDTAQETIEKVQQVVGEATDAARESADEQKLTV